MRYCFKSAFKLNVLILFLLIFLGMPYGQTKKNELQKAPFRYVIIDNEISENDDENLRNRAVLILLAEKSFSEQTLRTLFSMVSKRFPQPHLLTVSVVTSLDDLSTPEESDRGSTSESEKRKIWKHFWATYVRSNYGELFRFSPVTDKRGIKTVELRK